MRSLSLIALALSSRISLRIFCAGGFQKQHGAKALKGIGNGLQGLHLPGRGEDGSDRVSKITAIRDRSHQPSQGIS